MNKVVVPYEHNPSDFSPVWIAVVPAGQAPRPEHWRAALRDTVDGRAVLWARFPPGAGDVWVRDRDGARKAGARP